MTPDKLSRRSVCDNVHASDRRGVGKVGGRAPQVWCAAAERGG